MRPVVRRMCTMGDLKNGTLDLADVARMNDAIDASDENKWRLRPKDK